jgi:glycosyltransferase involved in cell wall biosynthesis
MLCFGGRSTRAAGGFAADDVPDPRHVPHADSGSLSAAACVLEHKQTGSYTLASVKAVHVTTRHPPGDVRIWLKECRTLAGQGYEIVLAAPVPNVHDRDGVLVKPVGVTGVRTGIPSLADRLGRVLATLRRERADVYHLHDPELIPVGLVLKLTGARVVLDAHEDTPMEVLAAGRGERGAAMHAQVWATAERIAGSAFDGIVAATPTIADRFPPPKTVLVRNFPLLEEARAFAGQPYGERQPELAYVGQLSTLRGSRELVGAMSRVSVDDATLVLAGPVHPGEPRLLEELRRTPGWERVRYEGILSRAGVAALLGRARAGVALLPPTRAHLDALPIKLFEYMAAGIPVLASNFPLWRGIVETEQCGLLVDPADRTAVAEAIDRLLRRPDDAQAMGEHGRTAFQRSYNWETEAARLLALYDRLRRASSRAT